MSEFFIIISKFINDQKELPIYTGHKQSQHKNKEENVRVLIIIIIIIFFFFDRQEKIYSRKLLDAK